jgi:hypothetical protein
MNFNQGDCSMSSSKQIILDAFNSEVYIQDKMDVQHTPLYDTVTVAAGAALNTLTSAFFTNVGAQSNKTLGLTNMTQSQKLPAPEAFSVFAVRLRWAENVFITDIQTILSRFALSLILGQKRYQLAPLWHFNAGGGPFVVTTRSSESWYANGVPSREAMHRLAIPIVIENQMTFSAQLEGTEYTMTASASGGTGITFQLLLDGFYARGIQ